MKCFVYVLYNDIKIRYIGVSIKPSIRIKNHIYNSFNKEGKEYDLRKARWIRSCNGIIKMKLIFIGTEEECYKKEMELVILGRRTGRDLTNLTNGGDKPPKINELPDFEIIKEKIRSKSIGRQPSKETRTKMSIAKKGKVTHLKNMSKGIENPRAFPIYQWSIEGQQLRVWPYAQQAIKELGLNRSAITDCLKGRQKTAGGYKWTID